MTAPEAPDAPGVVRLVVDTNALIRRVRLDALASELYTVPSVLAEVKDDGTANLVEHMMPKEMAVKSPSPEAMAAVRAQAQKSGDLRSLSLCDMEVMALTWQLHCEATGVKIEAPKQVTARPTRPRLPTCLKEARATAVAQGTEPAPSPGDAPEERRPAPQAAFKTGAWGSGAAAAPAAGAPAPMALPPTAAPAPAPAPAAQPVIAIEGPGMFDDASESESDGEGDAEGAAAEPAPAPSPGQPQAPFAPDFPALGGASEPRAPLAVRRPAVRPCHNSVSLEQCG